MLGTSPALQALAGCQGVVENTHEMAAPQDEVDAITSTARDLAYRQLDAQFQASNNFDAKSLGVLAFDGAALAVIVAARDLFYGWSWAIPAGLLVLSVLSALISIQTLSWRDGPDPRKFYDESTQHGVTAGGSAAANVALVSQLGGPKGDIAKNDRKLLWKSRSFVFAIWTTVVAGATSAGLIGLSSK
jgi:hypothetical protein